MKRAALLLALLVLTVGAWAGEPAQALPSCADVWSQAAKERGEGWHRYDYSTDRQYDAYFARVERAKCSKDWTILVYMAADNDLTPYAFWDLYEMEAGFESQNELGASSAKADLVVQLDIEGKNGLRRLHMQQTPEVYNPKLGVAEFKARTVKDVRSPVVEMVEENDAGSEAVRFERFLRWGVEKYPSRHVMVVVWGHGEGWAPATPNAPVSSRFVSASEATLGLKESVRFGGIGFNFRRNSKLDIPDIHRAMLRVATLARDGKPFDIYASNACLMQMTEVATEMADAADFIVGSTQVMNYLGIPYRRLMRELNSGRLAGEPIAAGVAHLSLQEQKALEPFLVARMIPRIFKFSLGPHSPQGQAMPEAIKSVTISTISSSELRSILVPALDTLGLAIQAYVDEDPLRVVDVQFVLQNAPAFMGGAQDIGSFLSLLQLSVRNEEAANEELTPRAANLLDAIYETEMALDRAVLAYEMGTDYDDSRTQLYMLGFRAFSIWLPVSPQDFKNRLGLFQSSEFYRAAPNWVEALSTIFR